MNRWKNKVAIVTGASFGIGAAIAKNLAQSGLQIARSFINSSFLPYSRDSAAPVIASSIADNTGHVINFRPVLTLSDSRNIWSCSAAKCLNVVGIARRSEKIEEHARNLTGITGKLIARKVDLTKENEIIDCFKWVTKNVGPVHILINNAAVIKNARLIDGDTKQWRQILDTNILSYSIASREAYQIMTKNKIDGHIVNINSIGGHSPIYASGMSLYGPSKFAITCYTNLFRKELISVGSKIKITDLSPGMVNTNITEESSKEIQEIFKSMPKLESEDVAQAVNYVLSTPPEVQVTQLTIQAPEETIV